MSVQSGPRSRGRTFRVAIRRFDPFARAIERQWAAFQAETGCPLTLVHESLDLHPLVDTLFTREGLKRGEWDIAFVVTDWLADAVAQEALLDLAPFMAQDPVPDYPQGWSPTLTRMQRFGEQIVGLPYHDGPECLIYRTDLFADPQEQAAFTERYGYALEPPRTWEAFTDVAQFFTRPGDGLYGTVFAAYPDGHNTVYDFCLQLWSRGGDLLDERGVPRLNSAEAVSGLDFYRSLLHDRGRTPPGLEQIDSVQSGELFASGSVAMMVNWFGFAAVCEQPGCIVKGKTGVTTLPAAPEVAPASLVVYWLLGVAAGSPHPETAYAFARHCCTPAMDKLTTLEGGIGCRLSTWADPEVNAMIPFYWDLPRLSASARTLPRSRSLPAIVAIIDEAVQAALTTTEPTVSILGRAQSRAVNLNLID